MELPVPVSPESKQAPTPETDPRIPAPRLRNPRWGSRANELCDALDASLRQDVGDALMGDVTPFRNWKCVMPLTYASRRELRSVAGRGFIGEVRSRENYLRPPLPEDPAAVRGFLQIVCIGNKDSVHTLLVAT